MKSERLKNKSIIITESFFNKEFNSPPSNSSKERLNELIKELALLEYVKPDNFIIKSKDQNLSQASTSKLVEIDQSEIKEANSLKDKNILEGNEDQVTDKEFNNSLTRNNNIITEAITDDQAKIKEELEEVKEMINEMKVIIEDNNQTSNIAEPTIESYNINDLAQDLITGSISQDEFFNKLKLLDETKNDNELISSIDNLKSLDEFLNLNILTQSIKMKSELLKSISEVNESNKNNQINKSNSDEIVCSDFTSFNYSDGRQNIVSSNKINIVNNSDQLSIYPILGSSKSSILINIKIEGKDICFDSDSKILISVRDGSRTEIRHESYDNCDGETVVFLGRIFGEKAFQDLNELKYKEIESIRVWMKNSLKEVVLSRTQSQQLMFTIDCLSSYMV